MDTKVAQKYREKGNSSSQLSVKRQRVNILMNVMN